MADAASLHCPNCGAPVGPGLRRCPYCEARLATVSCPSCFALMFDSAAYCDRCGAKRARAAAVVTPARCPGCSAELQRIAVGDASLLECGACDGVWVEAGDFERLCSSREAQAGVLHRVTEGPRPAAERVRYRPCVACAKMMNRVNFGRISGVVVDVCKGHGTFLDAGELHQIVAFIHAGGLDRARARQIEELKEQERQLRQREAQTSRDRGRSDPHTALNLSFGDPTGRALLELLARLQE